MSSRCYAATNIIILSVNNELKKSIYSIKPLKFSNKIFIAKKAKNKTKIDPFGKVCVQNVKSFRKRNAESSVSPLCASTLPVRWPEISAEFHQSFIFFVRLEISSFLSLFHIWVNQIDFQILIHYLDIRNK